MKALRPVALALLLASTGASANVGRDQAAAAAQQVAGGRVLAVEQADSNGRPVWRVKVVTPAGEVRVVLIDASTGRPL